MNYYARAIEDFKWLGCTPDECNIPGDAICSNLGCTNNEWSVFAINDIEDTKTIELITVRCFCSLNLDWSEGVALALISESFLKKQRWKVDPDFASDPQDVAGQLHYEIRDVKLDKIVEMGKYIASLFSSEDNNMLLIPVPRNRLFLLLKEHLGLICYYASRSFDDYNRIKKRINKVFKQPAFDSSNILLALDNSKPKNKV